VEVFGSAKEKPRSWHKSDEKLGSTAMMRVNQANQAGLVTL
jgi:hypothetical protein